ncbi:MAG TPA: hypothetical protein GX715_13000 [Armatimonadetes bacterium]|jgi:hypothetical protein|nr:hypothetical protein [Armatimonadota bacterium]
MKLSAVHLIHHTHMDIGYTDLPGEVLEQHLAHLDRALALCQGNGDLPEDRQFRWACESALLVQEYLRCRPRAHRERLLHALRAGWVETQACLTQPLTELACAEELIRCIGYAAELARREGFSVEAATIDDIGGYAGRLPTILQGFGVRYLIAGVGGFQVHLPWADLPYLFYLESKDGARVLVWNLGQDRQVRPQQLTAVRAVYGLASIHLIPPYREELARGRRDGVPTARERFAQLETRLENDGYPYDEVMLQYASDNGGPDEGLIELIARINATGEIPPIQLTTPCGFLRKMEARYGDRIPVLRGILTDPWVMRANPTPSPLKQYRQAQRTLDAAETYAAFEREPSPDPEAPARVDQIHANLQLYSDHTYGLSAWGWENSLDAEASTRAAAYDRHRKSWACKRIYAEAARQDAERLERAARQRLGASIHSAEPFVVVWNPSPVPLSEPVELYLGRGGPELAGLTDAQTGEPVPCQRIGNRRYLLLAPTVPACGYRRLIPRFGTPPDSGSSEPRLELENDSLRLRIDSETGFVTSIYDKRSGRERLDQASGIGFGEFLYHRYDAVAFGMEKAGMGQEWPRVSVPERPVGWRIGLWGPVAQSVVMHGVIEGPSGAIRVTREVILYAHAPRIDLRVRVDKPETPAKECCYVGFPFAGGNAEFRFEQAIGLVEPAEDLLPGAMQDAFYCPSWIDLASEAGGITVTSPDAPVFQFGRIRTGEWLEMLAFTAGTSHLFGWLYHNQLDTDCALWQEILDTFTYSIHLRPGGGLDSRAARQAAAPLQQPLYAEMRAPNPLGDERQPARGFVRITPESVRLLSLRRTGPSTVRLRLEETEGRPQRARVSFQAGVRSAWMEDLLGQRLASLPVSGDEIQLDLAPYALTTLAIDTGA